MNQPSTNQQERNERTKVSKVILIVVALHVLVIGGIFIFEGCSRTSKAPTPDMAENETPADQAAANAPAVPADATVQNNLVPATTPVAAPTQSGARTYVVRKGDSLWKIAKSQSVSIGDLARANSLTKTSALKVGQKLQVPSVAKAEPATTATASVIPTATDATAPTAAAAPVSGEGQMYTVKSGDSLWKIARLHRVSVRALVAANNLRRMPLQQGQRLIIRL